MPSLELIESFNFKYLRSRIRETNDTNGKQPALDARYYRQFYNFSRIYIFPAKAATPKANRNPTAPRSPYAHSRATPPPTWTMTSCVKNALHLSAERSRVTP